MSIQETALVLARKNAFVLRKHAPSIMTYAGVGGFIATVGLAIRATSKADDVAPKLREQIKDVKDENDITEIMTDREKAERLGRVYLRAGTEIIKIYGPTLTVGSASIILVMTGHGIMLKRQARLVAVYAALDASYRAYRTRVANEIGPEKEAELFRRPKMRALDQIEGEDGEDFEQTCMIDMGDVLPSPYARFFDESSPNWHKNAEFSLMFLKAQEMWANDRLRMHGYLFLNEVYEALGLERTQAGQIVGWKQNSESGDRFVSFGIENIYDTNSRAFVNGLENIVLLDFNVDGVIKI